MRGHNSTIQRKKKKCISCGLLKYIFSHGRCEECARVHNTKVSDDKDQFNEDIESVAILKKDADLQFSRLIRLRAAVQANDNGICSCFICGARHHYTVMQAGHYSNREDSGLRYHPKNVRVNCVHCNVTLKGNLIEYAAKLDAEEPNLSEWLYLEGNLTYKFTRNELKVAIADYSREIGVLLKKIKK